MTHWMILALWALAVVACTDLGATVVRRLRGARRCTRCRRYGTQWAQVWIDATAAGPDSEDGTPQATARMTVDWTLCNRCIPTMGEALTAFESIARQLEGDDRVDGVMQAASAVQRAAEHNLQRSRPWPGN